MTEEEKEVPVFTIEPRKPVNIIDLVNDQYAELCLICLKAGECTCETDEEEK